MKAGIYPPPVYVAVTQDGAEHRFSFWSPAGKPIDFARGRRAVESLLLTNPDCSPRQTVASVIFETGFAAFDRLCQHSRMVTRLYCDLQGRGAEQARNSLHSMRHPRPIGTRDNGSIVAGFVEHDSIGRVAHTAQDVAPKATRINWAKRAKDAREAIAAGNLSVAMSLLNAA